MSKHYLLATVLLAACGDSTPNATQTTCAAGTTLMDNMCVADATCGSGTELMAGMCVPTTTTPTYVQVEQLARPGINEALVI
jgi:hypothetical protein